MVKIVGMARRNFSPLHELGIAARLLHLAAVKLFKASPCPDGNRDLLFLAGSARAVECFQTIILLTQREPVPIDDTYALLRVFIETTITTCYLKAAPESEAEEFEAVGTYRTFVEMERFRMDFPGEDCGYSVEEFANVKAQAQELAGKYKFTRNQSSWGEATDLYQRAKFLDAHADGQPGSFRWLVSTWRGASHAVHGTAPLLRVWIQQNQNGIEVGRMYSAQDIGELVFSANRAAFSLFMTYDKHFLEGAARGDLNRLYGEWVSGSAQSAPGE